jgi:hypothetical protein
MQQLKRTQIGVLQTNENITREFDELIKQINKVFGDVQGTFDVLNKYAKWYTGQGIPSKNFGNDGELYLDEVTKTIYKKVNGSWL